MGIADKLRYVAGLEKKHGFKGLIIKAMERREDEAEADYRLHYRELLATAQELERQKHTVLGWNPRISVVVPAYETPELFLRQLIDSLLSQTYEYWELCIADGSRSDRVHRIVEEYTADAGKIPQKAQIVYRHIEENTGISGNTNVGFELATGDYIGLLDHDDLLASNALFEVAQALNEHPDAQLLYSDEDKVDAGLRMHMQAHEKLDYNPQLLLRYNYICHFLVVSAKLQDAVGGLDRQFDGSQDYDFVLRCTEQITPQEVIHIPKILYHWRVHQDSTAGSSLSKGYAYDAGLQALRAHLDRCQIPAAALPAKGQEFYQLHYRNAPQIDYDRNLAKCTPDGIRVISRGEQIDYILLQSPEVSKVRTAEVAKLYELCCQPGVGMVGGRLITRKKRVYSCGLVRQADGKLAHNFQGLRACYKGYFRRAAIPQNAQAVDLDFCLIKKEAWKQVGGPNMELDRPLRDMEYAERMQRAGYEVILNPQASAVYRGKIV